jgi:serine protease Do
MTRGRTTVLAFAAAMLLGAAVASAATAESRTAFEAERARLRGVIDKAVAAYVFVGGGSGAVISPDGYVITNNHVAGRTTSGRWTLFNAAGRRFVADIVGLAPATDLALLKIRKAKDLPYLPLGDSDALAVGDTVIAVGNPFALGNIDHTPTVTIGVVSATGINRPYAGDAVVTDTPINPGNSGGPLVNLNGELIGVNGQVSTRFGIRANTGSGYAVSSNQVLRYLDALKAADGGPVYPGSLLEVRLSLDRDEAAGIREVTRPSPAHRAGLQRDDVIVQVGPWPVASVLELLQVLKRHPAGRVVPLVVLRDGKTQSLDVDLVADRVAPGVILDRKDKKSLKVDAVIPGSPADKAGILPGDVIERIGRRTLRNRRQYQLALSGLRAGIRVPLVLKRNGSSVPVRTRLARVWDLRKLLLKAIRHPRPKPEPATRPTTMPSSIPAG